MYIIDFINTIAKRPRALKYSGFYKLLPEYWQTYVATLDKDNLREALYFLKHCLLEKDMTFAGEVVKENMKQHVMEPEALWTTYYRMTENRSLYLPDIVQTAEVKLPRYDFKIEDYDDLMRGISL